MNMLTSYDQAMSALSTALSSKQVDVVLKSRDDLDHIKLRARQLRDRELLANATEFQMRVERWLGELLQQATDAGHLYAPGRPRTSEPKPGAVERPARLRDLGIDAKLSMKARQAAALDQPAFDAVVADMRSRMASGKAKIVDAVDDAEKSVRRASPRDNFSFGFRLADGTPVGQVKLGRIRSRIEHLGVELEILTAISRRVGPSPDSLASVEESMSEAVLAQIIKAATE